MGLNNYRIRPPAVEGMLVDDVDTPALLLNLDVFEKNRETLKKQLQHSLVTFRPHAKSHKCSSIAHLQIDDGAKGICCQKVSEAEIMVQYGIEDILVSNQIVGKTKIDRLAKLATKAEISVCVDTRENVFELNKTAKQLDAQIGILVELDVGTGRCGVTNDNEMLSIAKMVQLSSNLNFMGIQAYQGKAQHIRAYDSRKNSIDQVLTRVKKSVGVLKQHELPCKVITGGGTGTFNFEIDSGIFNEVQLGSYIFMDGDYTKNLDIYDRPINTFKQSLFLLTTVMSHPTDTRAVVDVGLKSVAIDSGLPSVTIAGLKYVGASDEHGILDVASSKKINIGEKIKLIPGHCDPTVNLHDWIIGYRGNKVQKIWEIEARGAFF